MIRNRKLLEVAIWDKYVVYGVAFGIKNDIYNKLSNKLTLTDSIMKKMHDISSVIILILFFRLYLTFAYSVIASAEFSITINLVTFY